MVAPESHRRLAATCMALPWAVWAALRATGTERGFPLVPAMSFTSYAAATSVVPVTAAVLVRSRTAVLIAVASSAVLAGAVLVRRGRRPHTPVPAGPRLRLATVSLRKGLVRPVPVVDLVRRLDVDVLSVQELTPRAESGLRAAGIGGVLPWAYVVPARPGSVAAASGAVWTRLPAKEAGAVMGVFEQPTAQVAVPGSRAVEVTAVHTAPPARSPRSVRHWAVDLAGLPAPDDGVPMVLAGDFNATLDHDALRAVLRRGWVDAAQRVGRGLDWTWRPLRLPWPRLTIDHVLIDPRISVAAVQFVRLPGSDHRALVVDLVLPRAEADVHRKPSVGTARKTGGPTRSAEPKGAR